VRIAQRRYYRCRHCGATEAPWDAWAGVGNDHLTPQTRRMAVLAGTSWSFDVASARLRELCRVRLSADVIRTVTNAAGQRAQRWQAAHADSGAAFRAAAGEVEFYTDGTCVNTRGGWREMRLGVFAKRARGAPATPAEWATRALPAPVARVGFAGIRPAEACGPQWAVRARQLGLEPQTTSITALADGAKWIWKQVAQHLPQGTCVVDVFHVSEHLHACGRSLHGEQTPAARTWAEGQLLALLEHGPVQLLAGLAALRRSQRRRRKRRAVGELIDYLTPNIDGLWYRARLAAGLPIGSGLIEGACKTVVGRRLKHGGARWLVPRVENVAALCCLLYSEEWDPFWTTDAA
jgi:hypothetical protein